MCLLCLQDDSLIWAQRALQALKGIASHPVSFDFARAAAAPVASRQLVQAWQAFQVAVTRDAPPPEDVHTASHVVDLARTGTPTGTVTAPAVAVEAAPAATRADGSMAGAVALPEAGAAAKQVDVSDEADDEEVIWCTHKVKASLQVVRSNVRSSCCS